VETTRPARMQSPGLATLLGHRRPRGLLRRIDWWAGQLCSLECVFVLFLYSNELKTIINFPFPIDETVIFGGLCIPMMAYIATREGLYMRGLAPVTMAFVFIAWCITTTGWTVAHKYIYKDIAYLMTFTMLSLVVGGMVIANKRERTVRFFYLALAVALFMALVGLYIQFKTGNFRRWGQLDGSGRVYLAFGHTVVNGAGIAFCIALFARVGTVRQALGALAFAICSYFLLIGGGRGPFLGAALAALVAMSTRPPTVRNGRLELPYATVAAVVLLAAAGAFVAYLFVSGNLTTTLSRLTELQSEAERETSINGINRWDLWKAAYRLWLTAPWVGHGLSSFPVLYNGTDSDLLHPHDIFLEMLCETGLVGLALFLIFVWVSGRHASYARLRRDPLMVCVVLFVITSAMAALFGRDIVGVRKFFFAISLLALRPPPSVHQAVEDEREEGGESRQVQDRAAGRGRPAATASASPQAGPLT
jgi:O-antigen ligase